jgi:hypothetical protein
MRSPTPEADDDHPSFDQPTRHTSSSSIGHTSPPWSGSQGSANSPTAAKFDIEPRSFHRGMTPDQADDDDADEAERSLRPGVMSDDHADEEFDRVEEELRRNNDSLNPRLSRISVCPVLLPKDPLAHYQTESTTSLRTSHDKLQALQKHNTELGRKLKEAEKQLAVLGYVYTIMQAADVQVRERKAGRGSPRKAGRDESRDCPTTKG